MLGLTLYEVNPAFSCWGFTRFKAFIFLSVYSNHFFSLHTLQGLLQWKERLTIVIRYYLTADL